MNKTTIKKLSNVNFQVNNILDIYNQATENEIVEGKNWYLQANKIALSMSVKYKLSIFQCAGIIASLSPGTTWGQNIVDANNLCSLLNVGKDIKFITVTTYGRNKNKANYIFSHPELTEEEIFKIVLGYRKRVNKTSSFYINILHPERSEVVTIDRHSFRVNLNLTESSTIALTEKRYLLMNKAYQQAGTNVNVNPIELQAITWLVFRRLFTVIRDSKFETVPF